MVYRHIAQNYIAKPVWEYIEQGDKDAPDGIDYLTIEATTTSMVKLIVPCWRESRDLLSQWACIFEYILLSRANKINTEYFAQITIRYKDAVAFLKEISEDYCLRKREAVSNNVVKSLFSVDKSINHPRVDFL